MEFSPETDAILAKPANEWTSKEANNVYALMKEHGRDTVQNRMDEVRAAND